MRIICFLCFSVLFFAPLFAQKNLQLFIKDLQTTDEFDYDKIPQKVIQAGIRLGLKKTEIESNIHKISANIVKGNHYMTIITEMDAQKIESIINGHKRKIIKNDSFREWLHDQDKEESVSVLALEKQTKITKIVIIHRKNNEVQLYEFITDVPAGDFEKLFWKREYKKF